ncbi:MAG: hypothetical protein HQM04_15155 [Magnetococcales bacterium]|nr:hypothetical protein [Magnetococcales bacterium]MBF0116364.1 hypothetical protein [Magnetococcales bacterium]
MFSNYFSIISTTVKNILIVSSEVENIAPSLKSHFPDAEYTCIDLASDADSIPDIVAVNSSGVSVQIRNQKYDCIIMRALERLYTPSPVFKDLASLISENGKLFCSVKNMQYSGIIEPLLIGDFEYSETRLINHNQMRFYTYSSFIKLILDSGWLIGRFCHSSTEFNGDLADRLREYFKSKKMNENLLMAYLSIYEFFFECTLNNDYFAGLPSPTPITFIVAVNNERIFKEYLLASPVFRKGHPHQLVPVKEASSAASALHTGIHYAVNDCIVWVHQDVYLPENWDRIFCHKIREIEHKHSDVGIFGVFGVNSAGENPVYSGYVVDRIIFHNSKRFPFEVHSVDECLFSFRKSEYPGTDPNELRLFASLADAKTWLD